LQGQPDGEEALDDVIVQVSRDTVAVGQDAEFTHLPLRARQLPRQGGLIGERRHHVEFFVAEGLRSGACSSRNRKVRKVPQSIRAPAIQKGNPQPIW
jgi:hypothetical protein